ncbi:hypothetical protein DH2020_017973 [Rehmannia glutinosa]|uniref:Uncharacterized protein n=1 Tax=Rehmannia glutinosa TaxID=99300 RepID=A0ABR0WKB5_REHGL
MEVGQTAGKVVLTLQQAVPQDRSYLGAGHTSKAGHILEAAAHTLKASLLRRSRILEGGHILKPEILRPPPRLLRRSTSSSSASLQNPKPVFLWVDGLGDPEDVADLDPILLVSGVCGSILDSKKKKSGSEETRVWVRILLADLEFKKKLWPIYNPETVGLTDLIKSSPTINQRLDAHLSKKELLSIANVDGPASENADDASHVTVEDKRESRDNNDSKGDGTASLKGDDDGENGELNRGELDGLFCPICFEAWSSGGDHHCPQCKKKCGIKDIRLLYASRIVAVDGELQKTVQSLEAKCASLEKQVRKMQESRGADWSKKEAEFKKKESDLRKQVRYLKERTRDLEDLLEDEERRASGSSGSSWNCLGKPTLGIDAKPNFHLQGCSNKFIMQEDFQIDGARLFDIDSSSEIYVFARRLSGMGGVHVLTKNGTVLQFDMRYTMRHVECSTGLTCNPIHTLHSLSPDSSLRSGMRSVLTASSLGLCQWNFGGGEERPYVIPESDKQGVCISLAYCKSSDDIVASYRPKIETSGGLEISQPTLTAPGQGTRGSHVLYRKTGSTYQKLGATCANVSDIRLPKSAIIDGVYQNRLFASGDESTCELVLQELPSLMAVEHLRPRTYPIRDVKYIRHLNSGLLSCLSEDSLQLFTTKLL